MNLFIITSNDRKPHDNPSFGLLKSLPEPSLLREDFERFIYTMAHEVRNPLTNVILAIDALLANERDEQQEMYLRIAMRNSIRIKHIISDFLSSKDIIESKPEIRSVRDLLEEVLSANIDRIRLKSITLVKSYSASDIKVRVNSFKVKLALTNIIINAIEAMKESDGKLEITTKLLRGVCFIVVKDNGIGISKEDMNSIFKPYFTSKTGGMGLGLSGTLAILNTNNIGIIVRSLVGVGTRFIMSCRQSGIAV